MNTDNPNDAPGMENAPADVPGATKPQPPALRFGGGINHYPPRRSKIDDLLSDEDRKEYLALVMRNASIPKLRKWLKEHNYHVGRCTVERHRIKNTVYFENVHFGADVATQFARMAREAGLTLPESSIGGMHQLLMEFYTRQQKDLTLTATDVRALAAGVEDVVDTYQKVEVIKRELAETKGAGPEDQAAVVERVREILGV